MFTHVSNNTSRKYAIHNVGMAGPRVALFTCNTALRVRTFIFIMINLCKLYEGLMWSYHNRSLVGKCVGTTVDAPCLAVCYKNSMHLVFVNLIICLPQYH